MAGFFRLKPSFWLVAIAVVCCTFSLPLEARDKSKLRADYDYFVLSLSWSPAWCAENNDRQNDLQCRKERAYGFIVHGLWPQRNDGKRLAECSKAAWVDQSIIDEMMPIMPAKGLILHQWRKHGTCHGGTAADYFDDTRRAYDALEIPKDFNGHTRPIKTSLKAVEKAFIDINPGLKPEHLAVICKGRSGAEIRVCYDKDFKFTTCDRTVRDRCTGDIVFPAHR